LTEEHVRLANLATPYLESVFVASCCLGPALRRPIPIPRPSTVTNPGVANGIRICELTFEMSMAGVAEGGGGEEAPVGWQASPLVTGRREGNVTRADGTPI